MYIIIIIIIILTLCKALVNVQLHIPGYSAIKRDIIVIITDTIKSQNKNEINGAVWNKIFSLKFLFWSLLLVGESLAYLNTVCVKQKKHTHGDCAKVDH